MGPARVSSAPRGSAAGPTGLPPETEAVLRKLEYVVRNKLDGLLQGSYLGLVPGPGSEPGESRPYYPGDDVRRMDWPVTARTMTPHVRQTVADRELETWLVVDLSPSLDFGTVSSENVSTTNAWSPPAGFAYALVIKAATRAVVVPAGAVAERKYWWYPKPLAGGVAVPEPNPAAFRSSDVVDSTVLLAFRNCS